MKKILLTGSTGFVGKNLLENLCDKYEVDAPSRGVLNLNDPDEVSSYFRGKSYDCVIHASNPSPLRSADSQETMLVTMLTQYFGIVRQHGNYGKMIYFGSGAEYDKTREIRQVREEEIGTSIPLNQYGLAKYLMNQNARLRDSIYNLRLFGCFGPYEYWPSCFISNAICRLLYNMPISIRQNVYFDYLYIDDVISVVEWAIEGSPPRKDYNLCSGNRIDLNSIAKIAVAINGGVGEIHIKKEGLNLEYSGCCDRLLQDCTQFKITPLLKGIEKLFCWYKNNKSAINPAKILD
jgi:GDP-L-fucose synthase